MKKFLQNRLAKIRHVFSRDNPIPQNEVYVAEFDEKHPDKWEKIDDWPYIKWIRHHYKPRQDLFIPAGGPNGPSLDDLMKTRKTLKAFPDGKTDSITDHWRAVGNPSDASEYQPLWRGTTTFFVENPKTKPNQPGESCSGEEPPKQTANEVLTAEVLPTQIPALLKPISQAIKMVEICILLCK